MEMSWKNIKFVHSLKMLLMTPRGDRPLGTKVLQQSIDSMIGSLDSGWLD